MKALGICKKYRELAMEAVDGLINPDNRECLKEHLKECPDCRKYFKDMQIITKTAGSVSFEVPPYLESRIMAVIGGIARRPAFNFRHVFSFAASFAAVAVVALLIIYKNLDNRAVTIAAVPQIHKAFAARHDTKIAEKKQVQVAENVLKNAAAKPVPAAVNDAQPVKGQAEISSMHGSEPAGVNMAVNNASRDNAAAAYNMVKTDNASNLFMAKVTPVPTSTGNTLLDKDKAIVANNLINPLKGQAATIRILVDTPSHVKIIVYDKNARPISKILDEQKDSGTYETQWYGRADNGELTSEGVYFVYVQIGTRVIKRPVIVIK